MTRGKSITDEMPTGPVEKAVLDGDWALAREKMAAKLARMFDATDSAREVKSISITLDSTLDKCEANSKDDDAVDNPLSQILAEAEKVLADAAR